MVLTLFPVMPGSRVGPGLVLGATTDFVGPVLNTSSFLFNFTPTTGGGTFISVVVPSNGQKQISVPLMSSVKQQVTTYSAKSASDDLVVNCNFTFSDGNTQVDFGNSTDLTWLATEGVGVQQFELAREQGQQGSGLTPAEAQQLDETHASTFPVFDLSDLTLGLVPSPSPGAKLDVILETPVWGVIVRMTQIPEGLAPQTPDEDYWVQTLAVVRLYRGNDVWLRAPIHTSSKLIGFFNENLVTAVSELFTVGWQPTTRLQVTFLPGAAGDVLLMKFP